ncbi:hypothetical protein [Streptomyces sp. YGL11-2]|uniref:hypothetical protein n=1 Tax=Streptomyces sp. YGL11-2 TaxID=3414028 RepID=UPI003CEA5146
MIGLRIVGRLAVAAVVLVCTSVLLAQPASACPVGIGYKPSVSINSLMQHRTCSTGTSLAGAGTVAVLALGALAAAGWAAYRRGERPGPHPDLSNYLDATGVVRAEAGCDDAS